MMRPSLTISLLLAGAAAPAQASILVVGGNMARSCYLAAESGNLRNDALETCNRALTDEPLTREDRVATFVNRGIIYFLQAAVPQATADFDRALALDPAEPDAWLNKAVMLVQFRRSAEALPMVEKAIALKTRRPAVAYYIRALIYEDRGNLRAAYNDFQRARTLEPKWPAPARELARYQVRQP
jgi:tetratricopeptide (TPR) repeat protein